MIPVLLITTLVFIVVTRLIIVNKDLIVFFSTGSDQGFKFSEIALLWRLSKECNLEEPSSLYISIPTLNECITKIITDARRRGVENSPDTQAFLTKLYNYRTKINLDHENRRGIDSTKYLNKGQKLRIILKGSGVFTSEILNNGYEIVAKLPLQKNIIKVQSNDWIGQNISVYLWRKGDASYVFDTRVTNAGVFNGQTVIYLAQTNELLRAQKRRSVRCLCNINASMYFLKEEVTDYNVIETDPGYKVLLEDISEDGAMIRVGGQGMTNAQIKIQFSINDTIVIMYGIVRAVEYNNTINQSRLHFECLHLEEKMKNAILSFVYNVLPQDQKDIFEALSQTEEEAKADETAPKDDIPETSVDNQQVTMLEKFKEHNSQEDEKPIEIIPLTEKYVDPKDLDTLASLDVN